MARAPNTLNTKPGHRYASEQLAQIGLAAFILAIAVVFGAPKSSGAAPVQTDFPPTPRLTVTSVLATAVPTLTPTATQTPTPTTTPTFSLTPTVNPRGAAQEVVAGLQAAGVLPSGGRQLFSVPNGYALTSDPGYSFLPLGDGQTSRDFILGFQVGWRLAGPQSACGIRFRGQSADWRSAMLTADGRMMLTHLIGGNLIVNYDQPSIQFSAKSLRNSILLIAIGNTFSLYQDGQPQTAITDDTVATDSAARGDFAFEVYNPANNTVLTSCAYYNVWVWSFDERQSPTPTS